MKARRKLQKLFKKSRQGIMVVWTSAAMEIELLFVLHP